MKTGNVGTVIHGTLRPEDLIEAFTRELQWVSRNDRETHESEILARCDAADGIPEDDWPEIVNELIDALDARAPKDCYFGAHEGDGSDFGYWPIED
jgi:hypothetical protein